MLHLAPRSEARALLHVSTTTDPEPAAAEWAEATIKEVAQVTSIAASINPDLGQSEWLEDFIAAHGWLRRRGIRTPDAAALAVAS